MRTAVVTLWVIALVAGVYALVSGAVPLRTADQLAYQSYVQSEYDDAAATFADPMWKGVALFRDAEFERAAGVFAGFDTAEGAFNHGNALLMQGQYEDAAARYSRALEIKPDWDDALVNREIALGRAERLKLEGGDMTGGMLGADDIVFTSGDSPPSAGEEQTEGGQELSDSEVRALWLRQVQTKPADFLASKFAYQQAMRPAPGEEQESTQ